ncbi:hypothetical protein TcCL_Unassigned00135 [Trypanosoma cruzi]|nr:hypothetical protein TcCL_Unassigned00135 [Trypanosoma cruzi]
MLFCAILHPLPWLAQKDDQYLTRRRQPTKLLGNGIHHSHPQTREGRIRTERVVGKSRCSLPLLGVSEGLIHCRLSALLAHHRRQSGSTPRRTTPDVVTPVRDETARGLSECIAAECERFGSPP